MDQILNTDTENFSAFSLEKINHMIDKVVQGIHPEWPAIYKIRYIYLEIGKRLYRDTDFFFSVDGKLGDANLSISEIKDIYNSNIGRNFKVICRSASWILKYAYSRVGIRAELIETNTTIATLSEEERFLINHWFLAIYDDSENKVYFATLTPDLPYIQMNMETRHFASDIPYTRNYNGKVMQIYKGNEIKCSTIPRERLKTIDIEIGYIKNSYLYNEQFQTNNSFLLQYDNAFLYMLRDNMRDNKLFYELEGYQTDFYRCLSEFEGADQRKISLVDDDMNSLTDYDWNCFIKLMSQQVLCKINEILGYTIHVLPNLESPYWNYDSWLFNLCTQIQMDLFQILNDGAPDNFKDILIDVHNFKYSKWSRKVKNRFKNKTSTNSHDNILILLDKTTALVNWIHSKEKNGSFNELLTCLTYHFIDSSYLYETNLSPDGYLSNYYIANKFDKCFEKIFDCNQSITDFNNMGYSEQVVIIKDILNLMFPEVTRNNSFMLKGYNDNYNAVLNRIQMYPIKSKINGEYSILFNVLGNNQSGDYYFFYDPKSNIFQISNILDIYNDYIIISERMKNRISINDLEKIDEVPYKIQKK